MNKKNNIIRGQLKMEISLFSVQYIEHFSLY